MNFMIKVTYEFGSTEFIESDIENLGRDCEIIFRICDNVKVEVIKVGE